MIECNYKQKRKGGTTATVKCMYANYVFNRSECEEVIDIIEGAKNIWIKDLPPLFKGMMIEKFEEIIDRMFDGEEEIGKIDCTLAIEDVIIPAVETVFENLRNEKLKNLLSKFVCEVDNSTLYDALESKIAERERKERLKKSYDTKEDALADGVESPFEYHCWECGKTFWAEWRSNYSPAAICPTCETENR